MAKKTNVERAMQLSNRLKREFNYDVIEELVKLGKAGRVKPELKFQIAKEIMQYVYPKQKAVELDTSQGQPVVFNVDLGANNRAPEPVHALTPTE